MGVNRIADSPFSRILLPFHTSKKILSKSPWCPLANILDGQPPASAGKCVWRPDSEKSKFLVCNLSDVSKHDHAAVQNQQDGHKHLLPNFSSNYCVSATLSFETTLCQQFSKLLVRKQIVSAFQQICLLLANSTATSMNANSVVSHSAFQQFYIFCLRPYLSNQIHSRPNSTNHRNFLRWWSF